MKSLFLIGFALCALWSNAQSSDTLKLTQSEIKIVNKFKDQERCGVRISLIGVGCAGARIVLPNINIKTSNLLFIGTGAFVITGMLTIANAHYKLYKKGFGVDKNGLVYRF